MPCRCRCCSRYTSFIFAGETKSLEDYLNLFRRCVIIDILLAVAYVCSAAGAIEAPHSATSGGAAMSMAILLVLLTFLFALDAVMMLSLRRSAKAAAGADGSPPCFDAAVLAKLIFLKRVSVATSTMAIVVYLARIVLEFGMIGIVAGSHFSLKTLGMSLLFLVLIAGTKGLRLLAVNSFGIWVRARSDASQMPAESVAPGSQDVAKLAV